MNHIIALEGEKMVIRHIKHLLSFWGPSNPSQNVYKAYYSISLMMKQKYATRDTKRNENAVQYFHKSFKSDSNPLHWMLPMYVATINCMLCSPLKCESTCDGQLQCALGNPVTGEYLNPYDYALLSLTGERNQQ